MKALIDPNSPVSNITSFSTYTDDNDQTRTKALREDIPNSQRICEVVETQFEVASPLFWIDCNTSVNANDFYYDGSDSTIKAIIDATE